MARRRRRFRPGRRPRRGKRPSSFGEVVAVPFFQEAQWDRLRQVAADPEHVEASHGEWLAKLRRVEVDMKRIGVLLRTVDVDLDELTRFCNENALPNTRENRAKFAMALLRERQLDDGDDDDVGDDDDEGGDAD
jgi:hypothetical protein